MSESPPEEGTGSETAKKYPFAGASAIAITLRVGPGGGGGLILPLKSPLIICKEMHQAMKKNDRAY